RHARCKRQQQEPAQEGRDAHADTGDQCKAENDLARSDEPSERRNERRAQIGIHARRVRQEMREVAPRDIAPARRTPETEPIRHCRQKAEAERDPCICDDDAPRHARYFTLKRSPCPTTIKSSALLAAAPPSSTLTLRPRT